MLYSWIMFHYLISYSIKSNISVLTMEWEVQGLPSFADEIEQFKITLWGPIDLIAWLFD